MVVKVKLLCFDSSQRDMTEQKRFVSSLEVSKQNLVIFGIVGIACARKVIKLTYDFDIVSYNYEARNCDSKNKGQQKK